MDKRRKKTIILYNNNNVISPDFNIYVLGLLLNTSSVNSVKARQPVPLLF